MCRHAEAVAAGVVAVGGVACAVPVYALTVADCVEVWDAASKVAQVSASAVDIAVLAAAPIAAVDTLADIVAAPVDEHHRCRDRPRSRHR